MNCAISPTVSLDEWPYERQAGLGGSGAWALINGHDGVSSELDLGVGWQDPAVIREGGLCVWKSGARPILSIKRDGAILHGRMALHWTGVTHDTPGAADNKRDYDLIERAGRLAAEAVESNDLSKLAAAVNLSYEAQLGEGMDALLAAAGRAGPEILRRGLGRLRRLPLRLGGGARRLRVPARKPGRRAVFGILIRKAKGEWRKAGTYPDGNGSFRFRACSPSFGCSPPRMGVVRSPLALGP